MAAHDAVLPTTKPQPAVNQTPEARCTRGCPDFPGQPRRRHWSIPDPTLNGDTDGASYPAFQHTAADIYTRVRYLLPILATARGLAM
jgi:hypothetical protein